MSVITEIAPVMPDMVDSNDSTDAFLSSGLTRVPQAYVKVRETAYYVGSDGFLWACVEMSDSGAFEWEHGFNVASALFAEFEVFVPNSVVWFMSAVVSTLRTGIRRNEVVIDGSHLDVPIELDNGR